MVYVLVSVVMPVYNKAPHVLRAIESVREQTLGSFELVIVDDASTDGSAEIIATIDDPRIKLYRRSKPGLGGYQARNLGIAKAVADWIAFLDADDEWLADHLERMMQLSERHPKASILACGWEIAEGGISTPNPFYLQNPGKDRLLDCRTYLRVHADGADIANTDVVVARRSVLQDIGGFPLPSSGCKRAGDGQTWLRVMLSGATMAWSPHIGAVYHQDAVNMVTRKQRYPVDENGLITYIKSHLEAVSDRDTKILLKKYMNKRILSLIFQDARIETVQWSDVLEALRAFQWDPRLAFIISGFVAPRMTRLMLNRLAPVSLDGR